ncbi:MAG: GNAT family N-acetyltransferase [Haloferacaceae archaeon]
MEFAVVGWPEADPTLDLDHRRFAYAGKFVMSTTGKAVARDAGTLVGAVAFDADRTDPETLRLRYVTVRDDRRGEAIGPRLCAFVVDRARERGYERARIAVNNPFAYEALYKAGFGYTGERTGLAELVLERPSPRSPNAYREGMAVYADRDLDEPAASFAADRCDGDPPPLLDGVDPGVVAEGTGGTGPGTEGAGSDTDGTTGDEAVREDHG